MSVLRKGQRIKVRVISANTLFQLELVILEAFKKVLVSCDIQLARHPKPTKNRNRKSKDLFDPLKQ